MGMKKIFLNDHTMLLLIIINTLLMFVGGFYKDSMLFDSLDALFTLLFIIEAAVKMKVYSWKKYWADGWNKFDFIIILAALPSLLNPFIEGTFVASSIMLSLRTLRVFKSFKLFRFIPNISKLIKGTVLAIKSSFLVCLAYGVFILVFSIMTCALFGTYAPEYFGNPLQSMYSIFRLCTVEGWYDMPNAIAEHGGTMVGVLARIYFCFLLFAGGIIGMSLINSIFVDAMIADNNDDVLEKLEHIEQLLNNKKN